MRSKYEQKDYPIWVLWLYGNLYAIIWTRRSFQKKVDSRSEQCFSTISSKDTYNTVLSNQGNNFFSLNRRFAIAVFCL